MKPEYGQIGTHDNQRGYDVDEVQLFFGTRGVIYGWGVDEATNGLQGREGSVGEVENLIEGRRVVYSDLIVDCGDGDIHPCEFGVTGEDVGCVNDEKEEE